MSCFSKKSNVVTIDYEFWRRLNSEIDSGKVANYEQGTAVNLQFQADGNTYVRKSMLCGNSNQFCFVFGSFQLQSDPKLLEKSKLRLFAGEQNEDKIFDLVSCMERFK